MNIKLSICIPTYNRALLLQETLDNVITQATDEVEIVVSDNASPDNTQEMVRACQERFPRLTYVRQPENRGADSNYLNVVAHAKGEYCWLLGDDDLLEDGAISFLLETCLNGMRPVDFVQVAVTTYDFCMETPGERSAEVLGIPGDVYTTDALSYFTRFFRESYLSGFIVKREKWNKIDPAKYLGTGLSYLAVVYEYLQPDSPALFVARPLVKYRSGSSSWSSSALEILVGNMNFILDTLPARYNPVKPEARRLYNQRLPITPLTLARLRADGHYSLTHYRKYMHGYYADRPLHRLFSVLLAVLPTQLLRGVRQLYKKRDL